MRRKTEQQMLLTLAEIEKQLEWVEVFLGQQSSPAFQKISQYTLIGKSLVFAAAAQLAADIFDKRKQLLAKPQPVFVPEEETLPYCVSILYMSSLRLNKLRKLTRWQTERQNQIGNKLAAAYYQVDGLKSALAVTLAGYNYLDRFDEEGDIIVEETESEQPRHGYV